MDTNELISRLAVALGIGLLIGLERGWRRRGATPGSRAAGIRTFALSGLLGGVIAALAQAVPEQRLGGAASLGIVLGVAFAAYSVVIALFTRDENQAAGNLSATTAIAGMLTFALGAYALLGDMRIAAGAAVAATALLASREELHGWVEKITWPELRSAVVLLAMTFIGLPILPDRALGPFGGVNLRDVWLIAIVLASVSFLGYVAVKYFGARRGLLLAAAAGGVASSTAVTITNARRAIARTKQVVHVVDFTTDYVVERNPMAIAGAEIAGIRSLVVVPMLKDDDLVGLLIRSPGRRPAAGQARA
jgi:uncharacterized membrane protein (DUF4010 family)